MLLYTIQFYYGFSDSLNFLNTHSYERIVDISNGKRMALQCVNLFLFQHDLDRQKLPLLIFHSATRNGLKQEAFNLLLARYYTACFLRRFLASGD